MIRFFIALLCLAVIPTYAMAFDCSGAEPLICNGPALSGTIGIPPELSFTQCGGTTNYKHKLYSLTLTSAQEVTVSLTGSAASVVEMVVFDACDETACLVESPANSSVLPAFCLPPGTYTVALKYLVEAVMPYEISASCESCVPVAIEDQAWGSLKTVYR